VINSGIFTHLKERKTRHEFPFRNGSVEASLKEEKGNYSLVHIFQSEYELSLEIRVKFYATTVQYPRARELAIKRLKHAFYKDIIADIQEALSICDQEEVRRLLSQILTTIQP